MKGSIVNMLNHLVTGQDDTPVSIGPRGGDMHLHPVAVETIAGAQRTITTADGTVSGALDESEVAHLRAVLGNVRGVITTLYFKSEEGRTSLIRYQFHKGVTYHTERSDVPLPAEALDGRTIWRD